MRIKFLSVIATLFSLSLVISSCLENDKTTTEYSTDATIHAFGLDAILGKNYRFTIDQLNGKIYNLDSLPMGSDTILDKILIDTLTSVSGAIIILNQAGTDSIIENASQGLNTTDSFDLRKPIQVKVLSMEAVNLMYQGVSADLYNQYTRRYTIEIRVHQQDPDSLNWGEAGGEQPTPVMRNFSGGEITGTQKAVILGEQLFVYAKKSDTQLIAYKTAIKNPRGWAAVGALSGLPTTVDLSSILPFNNQLYAIAEKEIYFSANGTDWQKHTTLNDRPIESLLVGFPANKPNNLNQTSGLAAVSIDPTEPTKRRFSMTNKEATQWQLPANQGEWVPEEFPTSNISATVWINNTGIQGAMLMGTAAGESAEYTLPWSSYSGSSWADLYTSASACPPLSSPSIIHYGGAFYAFDNAFETFYTSLTGIVWQETAGKFYFPTELTARKGSDYSMAVDSDHFIWIICSKNQTGTDDVWRCRLNKLSFTTAAQ